MLLFVMERQYLVKNLWGMLCNCAVRKNRQLYDKLAEEYRAKNAMKHLRRSKSAPVKLSAMAYLVHPGLMYHGLAMVRKVSG